MAIAVSASAVIFAWDVQIVLRKLPFEGCLTSKKYNILEAYKAHDVMGPYKHFIKCKWPIPLVDLDGHLAHACLIEP